MIATILRIGFHVTVAPSGLVGKKKKKRFGLSYAFHMCVYVCVCLVADLQGGVSSFCGV